EAVVSAASAAQPEEQIYLLAAGRIDDAVVIGDHLDAQIAVDAVLLRVRRGIREKLGLVGKEFRRDERPLLDAGGRVDRVQEAVVRREVDDRVVDVGRGRRAAVNDRSGL